MRGAEEWGLGLGLGFGPEASPFLAKIYFCFFLAIFFALVGSKVERADGLGLVFGIFPRCFLFFYLFFLCGAVSVFLFCIYLFVTWERGIEKEEREGEGGFGFISRMLAHVNFIALRLICG